MKKKNCFSGGIFFKIKIADILICNESNIWAKVYHFRKMEV